MGEEMVYIIVASVLAFSACVMIIFKEIREHQARSIEIKRTDLTLKVLRASGVIIATVQFAYVMVDIINSGNAGNYTADVDEDQMAIILTARDVCSNGTETSDLTPEDGE